MLGSITEIPLPIKKRVGKRWYESSRMNAKGIAVHEAITIPKIQDIVKEQDIKLIVELGTAAGGFTLSLGDAVYPDGEVHTFEYKQGNPDLQALIDNLGDDSTIIFHFEDVLTEASQTIIDLLNRPEKKLFYCDNGNKSLEFHLYADYLNKGDLLACHDWPIEIDYAKIKKLDKDVMTHFTEFQPEWFDTKGLLCSTRMWTKD